jgi:hypothetical protein
MMVVVAIAKGGHHASRTGAEIVLVVVGFLFIAGVIPLTMFSRESLLWR